MSPHVSYSVGQSFLIVGPTVAALTGDAGFGQRIWPLIKRGATGHAVLEEGLRGGLTQLPDLLLIEFDGSRTRVFVRGSHSADVQLGDGSLVSCTGENATTWSEQAFDDVCSGAVNTADGARLPIVAGMVPASGFDWESTTVGPQRAEPALDLEDRSEPSPATHQVEARSGPVDPPSAEQSPVMMLTVEGPTGQQVAEELLRRMAPAVSDAAVPLVSAEPTQAPPSRPGLLETRTEPADEGFDHLFGATIHRSIEDAAVRETIPNSEPSIAPLDTSRASSGWQAGSIGDHDGSTVMVSALAGMRPTLPEQGTTGAASAPPAVLELSTGDCVPLDRGVVIGRRPQIDRVAGDAIPRMITVHSPLQDISRSHLQITSEGENYTVTDLHSMNGSVVIGPDGASRILSGGDTLVLRVNDVIDIGEGITITLRLAQ